MIRLFLNRFALPVNVDDVQFAYRLPHFSFDHFFPFFFFFFSIFIIWTLPLPLFVAASSEFTWSLRTSRFESKEIMHFVVRREREEKESEKKKKEDIDDVCACKRPSSNYWNQLPTPWYSTTANRCELNHFLWHERSNKIKKWSKRIRLVVWRKIRIRFLTKINLRTQKFCAKWQFDIFALRFNGQLKSVLIVGIIWN